MNRIRVLMVTAVLLANAVDTVCATDDWVQTTAAVRLWPVTEGGNGHTYQPVAVPELIPWTSADRAATHAGGYLATITSQAENDFVFAASAHTFVQAIGNHYGPWLGGYQLPGAAEPAGGWVWVTGEPFEYTAWAAGEPSQTAGPLNEDRIHYLGHGQPEPAWNDQTNSLNFGPMAYVIEYDPVVHEAEEAMAISGGRIESTLGEYSGTGYVRLEGQAGNTVEWAINVGMAGPRAILLRYSHGASQGLPAQIIVNGIVAEPNLPCVPAGVQDAWDSTTVQAYFSPGENVVAVHCLADTVDLCIDKITVFGDTTNLVLNQRIALSAEAPAHPASQAIDADTLSSWRADGLPQWLEVDLGDIYPIYRTQVVCSPWQACQFRVDAKAWAGDAYSQVVDRTNNTTPGTAVEPIIDTFTPTCARYVRLTVTGTDWGAPEIVEFRVAAVTGQVPPIAIGTAGYPTIQAAVDAAHSGDVIVLQPGRYSGGGNESIAVKGKRVTLTSMDPDDSGIVADTVIAGTDAGPAVSFTSGEDANCVLAGLTISGAGTGIYCRDASPTIRHCRIVGHRRAGIELYANTRPTIRNCIIAGNRGPGVMMGSRTGRAVPYHNYPQITNCTIVENLAEGIKGGNPTVVNSIIYLNGVDPGGAQIDSYSSAVTYSDVQGGCSGDGNLDIDPGVARWGFWVGPDDPGIAVLPGYPDATWVSGDYHLQSPAGRWDPDARTWVVDAVVSPCIDAGDPGMGTGQEPLPNGERINLGAYGGTHEAGISLQAQ